MWAKHVDFERWQAAIEEYDIQFDLQKLESTAINSECQRQCAKNSGEK